MRPPAWVIAVGSTIAVTLPVAIGLLFGATFGWASGLVAGTASMVAVIAAGMASGLLAYAMARHGQEPESRAENTLRTALTEEAELSYLDDLDGLVVDWERQMRRRDE